MRFNELKDFFAHLKSLNKNSNLNLIIISDDYERAQIIQYVKHFFFKNEVTTIKLNAADTSYQEIEDEANSMSLFSSTSLIIIDNVQKTKGLAKFSHFVEKFKSAFFILAAPSSKGIEMLEKKSAQHGLVLNLSKEKPWDRNKRIENMLFFKAKKQNVVLTPQAHKRLIEKLGYNLSSLDQELQKLILYTYDLKRIEVEDVETIVDNIDETTLWQMAEELIFEKKYPSYLNLDANSINQFTNALRYHLQLGFKLRSYMKEQISAEKLKSYFPKLWPKQFEKKKLQVMKFSLSYFQKALSDLYDVELTFRDVKSFSKSNLELFISKILS